MTWGTPCLLLLPVLPVLLESGEMPKVKERGGAGSRVALCWVGGVLGRWGAGSAVAGLAGRLSEGLSV